MLVKFCYFIIISSFIQINHDLTNILHDVKCHLQMNFDNWEGSQKRATTSNPLVPIIIILPLTFHTSACFSLGMFYLSL